LAEPSPRDADVAEPWYADRDCGQAGFGIVEKLVEGRAAYGRERARLGHGQVHIRLVMVRFAHRRTPPFTLRGKLSAEPLFGGIRAFSDRRCAPLKRLGAASLPLLTYRKRSGTVRPFLLGERISHLT